MRFSVVAAIELGKAHGHGSHPPQVSAQIQDDAVRIAQFVNGLIQSAGKPGIARNALANVPARTSAVARSARLGSLSRTLPASLARLLTEAWAAAYVSRDLACLDFSASQATDLPAMPSLIARSTGARSARSSVAEMAIAVTRCATIESTI